MENIQTYIGIVAGLLELVVYYLILQSMRKGITKPNLAGWVLYSVAILMIVASSAALGAWQTIWLPIAYFVGQAAIIGLSLRTGYFAFSRFDYVCIGISLVSLVIWIYTSNPLYALILNVIVDGLGSLAIANKLYVHPGTEDTTAWTLATFVAIINLFAVASFDISNALFPVYIVFANGIVAALSLRRARTDA